MGSLYFSLHEATLSVCCSHLLVSGCLMLVIFWLLDFFPTVVYGHIWCVLWLLFSDSAASEIKALRFSNGLHESPWHCVCTVLREGGRCGTGQHCQEHRMVRPGPLWPLVQQWQGKHAHLSCALWRHDLPGLEWERAELCPPTFTLGYIPASGSAPGWPMWAAASVPRHFKAQDFDFQSNHVKSHCLLFLFLQEIHLISSQYPCLKSAATGKHPVPMHKHTEWSKEKRAGSKHFLIKVAVWSNENNKQTLGDAAMCPGTAWKEDEKGVLWCPGKDLKSLLKVYRADWINSRLYQSVLYLCAALPSCPQQRPVICHQSCATAVMLSCFNRVMGNDV